MSQYLSFCPTCGCSYNLPGSGKINFCSNSFHCCRDCTWEAGRITELCVYHQEQNDFQARSNKTGQGSV